jgi:hypothetical protein
MVRMDRWIQLFLTSSSWVISIYGKLVVTYNLLRVFNSLLDTLLYCFHFCHSRLEAVCMSGLGALWGMGWDLLMYVVGH